MTRATMLTNRVRGPNQAREITMETNSSARQCTAEGCCSTHKPEAPAKTFAGASGLCSDTSRREFLQAVGLGGVAALTTGLPAVAGPFEAADFEKLVPADKKLDGDWLR